MGHVASNLVDLAEYRTRKTRERIEPSSSAVHTPGPVPVMGYQVAIPVVAVSCFWVPVWVSMVPVAQMAYAERRNA